MSSLPFEILNQIFIHLSTKDLAQCQLTCKNWNKTASNYMYSEVEVSSEKQSFLFTRTILDSLLIGSYLKIIKLTYSTYQTERQNRFIDDTVDISSSRTGGIAKDKPDNFQHDLLNVLMKNCPNIIEIKLKDPNPEFFTKIAHAYTQGQLLNLSILPEPEPNEFEEYVNAALTLKKNLKNVYLYEKGPYRGHQYSVISRPLRDQIHEFKSLQRLNVTLSRDRNFYHLEALIEDCPNLKDIQVYFFKPAKNLMLEDTKISINPRPGVHRFGDSFGRKSSDLPKYILQKFTNLQYLKVGFIIYIDPNHDPSLTSSVVGDFLCYALNLPDCYIQLSVKESDFIDACASVVNVINIRKNIVLDTHKERQDRMKDIFMTIHKDVADIYFPVYGDTKMQSYYQFLSKFGSNLQSLEIKSITNENFSIKDYYNSRMIPRSLNWRVKEILEFCPFLQNLTICGNCEKILLFDHEFLHGELKSLSFTFFDPALSTVNLMQFISGLPNLKKIRISYMGLEDRTPDPLRIFFPKASLNLLICEFDYSREFLADILERPIEVNTSCRRRLYKILKGNLLLVDAYPDIFIYGGHEFLKINCTILKNLCITSPFFTYTFPLI